MDPLLYQELDDFSLNSDLTNTEDYSCKKIERIVMKDSEWPEMHTVITAGYIHDNRRFGFDGFKDSRPCEAKSSSRTIKKDLLSKYLDGKIQNKKDLIKGAFDGSGTFSKFTHRAFKKHVDSDVIMLISGYANGVLLYVIEFPFNYPGFANMVHNSLVKSLPGGDQGGLSKTISFSYIAYKDCPDVKVKFLTREYNKRILRAVCTEPFYAFLHQKQLTNLGIKDISIQEI